MNTESKSMEVLVEEFAAACNRLMIPNAITKKLVDRERVRQMKKSGLSAEDIGAVLEINPRSVYKSVARNGKVALDFESEPLKLLVEGKIKDEEVTYEDAHAVVLRDCKNKETMTDKEWDRAHFQALALLRLATYLDVLAKRNGKYFVGTEALVFAGAERGDRCGRFSDILLTPKKEMEPLELMLSDSAWQELVEILDSDDDKVYPAKKYLQKKNGVKKGLTIGLGVILHEVAGGRKGAHGVLSEACDAMRDYERGSDSVYLRPTQSNMTAAGRKNFSAKDWPAFTKKLTAAVEKVTNKDKGADKKKYRLTMMYADYTA